MSLRNLCKFSLACAIILAVPALRAADATLLKKTGSVTVIPKGGQATELNVNDKIPDGATVKTGPGAEAYIQALDGAVATMKANTVLEIGTGNATVNLKSGNLVSTIDPAKKANYTVRTPKGVAAARGTAFSASVTDGNVSIAATADRVTFTLSSGAIYSVSAGMVSITPPGASQPSAPVPLAQAAVTNPEVVGVMQAAVQTMSSVVQNNLGGMSAESATNLATQVIAVASAAVPTQAASFTTQVVTAMTSSTASTATTAATTSTAIASVTAAAAQAAPLQASQIAVAAVQAAPQQTALITAVVNQVAPAAQQQTVAAVAQATGQSETSIQTQATGAAGQANTAVNSSNAATGGVVAPPPSTTTLPPAETTQPTPTPVETTPPVDPSVTVPSSPAGV